MIEFEDLSDIDKDAFTKLAKEIADFKEMPDVGGLMYQAVARIRRLEGELNGPDMGWVTNFKHLLDRCKYTIRVREGGGPESLVDTAILTFTKMENELEKFKEVAEVKSWTNGSYWRNYKIDVTVDVPANTKLYMKEQK